MGLPQKIKQFAEGQCKTQPLGDRKLHMVKFIILPKNHTIFSTFLLYRFCLGTSREK